MLELVQKKSLFFTTATILMDEIVHWIPVEGEMVQILLDVIYPSIAG